MCKLLGKNWAGGSDGSWEEKSLYLIGRFLTLRKEVIIHIATLDCKKLMFPKVH